MLLFSAPMAGVTDKPFRLILRKFTNQPIYTEMIGASSLYHNHYLTRKMLKISDEKNLIVQLVGIDEKYMVEAAKQAEFYGATGIDINMGCPVKKLITNGSGAALMKNADVACRLVDAIKRSVSVPVFAKTRVGWDETSINVVEFAKSLENAGVDRITIHGRTKDQGYSGSIHFEEIAKVKKAVKIPVIANGDVVSKVLAEEMIQKTGADGLMIGRAALGQPWILSEIETGTRPAFHLDDLVLEHLELMLDYYGMHGLKVARKHIAWYAKGKKGLAEFCQSVYAEQDLRTIKKMIKTFFER